MTITKESARQIKWDKRVYPRILEGLTKRQIQDVEKYPVEKLPVIPEDKGLYIYGPVNSGKTTLCIQLYIAEAKRRHFAGIPGGIKFITAYDFFEDLRKAMFVRYPEEQNPEDGPPRDEYAALAEYGSVGLLFFDDLGSIKLTDRMWSQLQILIDQRYEAILPTVFTSNLSLEELEDTLGDKRTSSRIKRTCKLLKVKA